MGASTCALGRLNSGPLTPRTAFVDKPVPGAPSLLIRWSRQGVRTGPPGGLHQNRGLRSVGFHGRTTSAVRSGSQNGSCSRDLDPLICRSGQIVRGHPPTSGPSVKRREMVRAVALVPARVAFSVAVSPAHDCFFPNQVRRVSGDVIERQSSAWTCADRCPSAHP